ncbi:BV-E31/ADPRase [Parapoynx stagnalis nucleopolyhedrovirus]|uniref:BV-E31/ADPRase n=1 Tax=Parapoynx stagnalis nucleopolyhedrovirus TaxID=2993413 RepID=A0A9E7YAP2_9ABAC|nr:BV-E31/ADPRase [Parapoynx stagnalis nucleopolyhedrovirus]
MRNSAGLFIITEPDKAVLLNAHNAYRQTSYNNRDTFLEKISIPRGHRDCCDSKVYETAMREFIEETGCFFDNAFIYKYPFELKWEDDGVVYTYLIYVGMVRGNLNDVNARPNTYTVKLLPGIVDNYYDIILKPRRFNCEIIRSLKIVPLNKYFQYMTNKQLITYDSSNYLEFFEFVKTVKAKFDEKKFINDNFLFVTLKKINDLRDHEHVQSLRSLQRPLFNTQRNMGCSKRDDQQEKT